MISLDSFFSQGEMIATLPELLRSDRMPHAVLITGAEGVGKWTLARTIAAALLCDDPEGEKIPCGKCKACMMTEHLSHPDLIILQKGEPLVPTDTKTVIPVEDIREMIRRLSLQGFQSNRHVIIIRHAEDMNESAQNKLLKTLEEPSEGTFFLLTSDNADLLLPTIISRCCMIKLHPWTDREVTRVLTENGITEFRARETVGEANGSFGRALRIATDEKYWEFRKDVMQDFLSCRRRSDILSISTKWKDRKEEADELFSILENLFSRLMRISLKLLDENAVPQDCPDQWKKFAGKAGTADYHFLFEEIGLARKRIRFSVNFQTVTEQLLLSFMEALEEC